MVVWLCGFAALADCSKLTFFFLLFTCWMYSTFFHGKGRQFFCCRARDGLKMLSACSRVRLYIIRYIGFFSFFFKKSSRKVLLLCGKCVPLSPQKRGWPFALCGRASFFLSFRVGSLTGFHRQIDTAVQERKRTVNVRSWTRTGSPGEMLLAALPVVSRQGHYTVKSLILAQDER